MAIENKNKEVYAIADEMNDLWLQINEILKDKFVRQETFAYYNDNEAIGYLKLDGKWAICHGIAVGKGKEELETWEEPEAWTPFCECRLEDKISLASGLPSLLKELSESNNELLAKAKMALEIMRTFITSCNHKGVI